MKKIMALAFLLLSVSSVSSQIENATPYIWCRADSSTLGNPTWKDISPNHFAVFPDNGTLPSSYCYMNFNKCFESDSAQFFHVSVDSLVNRGADMIVVYATSDSMSENGLWSLQLDSVNRVGLTSQNIRGEFRQLTYDTVNKMPAAINYLSQSWQNADSVCQLKIGKFDSMALNGHLAEFLFFNHHLEDTAVTQWMSYLSIKYGITLHETDYMDNRKNVIWDYTGNPDYSSSIAGIGRDDSTGLYQKQTYFASGLIVFGLDSMASTNEGHSGIMSNGDFIVMGMDSRLLQSPGLLYLDNGETFTSYGHSLVKVSTGSDATYNTFLRLQTADFASDSTLSALMIDRSGSGDYPLHDMELYYPSGQDSGHVYWFTDLQWDTDGSGTDAFCFVLVDITKQDESDGLLQTCSTPAANHSLPRTDENGPLPNGESKYSLYPNPTKGNYELWISYPVADDVEVKVYSADGKLLQQYYGSGSSEYRFSGQVETSGHYLIDITGNAERKSLKMIVQ